MNKKSVPLFSIMNYDYNYVIERILYIGDNLYTVSKSLVKKIDINTMQVTARSINKKVIFPKQKDVMKKAIKKPPKKQINSKEIIT